MLQLFFKMGQSRPLFVYFLITISITQIEKSVDGVLGIRTWATGWYAQMKPRSYGGHPWMLQLFTTLNQSACFISVYLALLRYAFIVL